MQTEAKPLPNFQPNTISILSDVSMIEKHPEMEWSKLIAIERFNYAIYEIVDLAVKH